MGKIQFHDLNPAFECWDLPNVNLFQEQIQVFKEFLMMATPDDVQQKDVDFLLAMGEIFSLIVYCQLFLENATIYNLETDLINQVFDVMVRDFSRYALELHNKTSSSPKQMEICTQMLRKPVPDADQYRQVWEEHVHSLNGAYEMNP